MLRQTGGEGLAGILCVCLPHPPHPGGRESGRGCNNCLAPDGGNPCCATTFRYPGSKPYRALEMRTSWAWKRLGSLCNSFKRGVAGGNLFELASKWAAAFWTTCDFRDMLEEVTSYYYQHRRQQRGTKSAMHSKDLHSAFVSSPLPVVVPHPMK